MKSFHFSSIVTGFLVLFFVCGAYGKKNQIDSLKRIAKIETAIETKVSLLNSLCSEYQTTNYDYALKYAKEALDLSTKIQKNDKKTKALISQSANNVGAGYLLLDNYEQSLKYLLMALKIAEEIDDTNRMSNALYNLSMVYDYKDNQVLAINYLEQSINLDEKSGNLEAAAYGYGSLAADYFFKPDYNKGMVYYNKAMEIANSINDMELKAVLYENRAVGLQHENKYAEALIYHKKAISIDLELNHNASLETNYLNIADLYKVMNNNNKAIEYNNKSLEIAMQAKSIKTIMKAYYGLAESYEQIGNKAEAYKNLQLYANWKDSLYQQENATAMAEMQTKYDIEKKEAENAILTAEKEVVKAKLDKKSVQQKLLLALLGLVVAIVIYVVYSLNQKKKINKLLNNQNEEIIFKNKVIAEKNKDITDSINYAQRIQETILPELAILQDQYESFVYYQPKDIVSGDFYWFKEIGNKFFFSVVDCTGHGVPGAFMSIIGANSLNKIVEDLKIEDPGAILDELNLLVNDALGANGEINILNMKDGMDISICVIDKTSNQLAYAGANNSLYLLRDSSRDLPGFVAIMENNHKSFFEVKSDKMAIGGGDNNSLYTTHTINLEKSDTVYLFSDGYADQFGGPKEKKFMNKSFKRMLLSIQDKPMNKQLAHIDNTMKEWKGDLDQLDDICIMGVRI